MKICDACTVRTGHAFRSRIDNNPIGNIRVIQPKDISDAGLLQTEDACKVEMSSVKPLQRLAKNDVLLVTRGRFASAVFHRDVADDYIASGSILVLRIKKPLPVLLPEYLALYFNSKSGKRQLSRLNETTTVPFISRSNLEQIDIPLPSQEQQKALVALQQSKHRYGRLTARKLDLLNELINHELSTIN